MAIGRGPCPKPRTLRAKDLTLPLKVKILRNICLCQFNTALASHGMADRSRVVGNSRRWINLGAPDGALLNQRYSVTRSTLAPISICQILQLVKYL